MSAILLPIGQSLGSFHPGPGLPSRGTGVRIGDDVRLLTPGLAEDLWHVAHGVPGFVGQLTWGREAVPVAVRAHEPAEVQRAVDGLLDRGLLAEVDPADEVAVGTFGAAHSWQSLLAGLGEQASGNCGVGVPGAPPVREVAPSVYEFWCLAPALGTLTTAAGFLASPGRGPDRVLADVVGTLHELLCVGAGFLEPVAPEGRDR